MACFRNVGDDNDVSVRVAIWFCRAEAPQEGTHWYLESESEGAPAILFTHFMSTCWLRLP